MIAGPKICALGIAGHLHRLDKKSGRISWSHDLIRDYGGRLANCGYGSSPLVYEAMLIVQVGGKEHAHQGKWPQRRPVEQGTGLRR